MICPRPRYSGSPRERPGDGVDATVGAAVGAGIGVAVGRDVLPGVAALVAVDDAVGWAVTVAMPTGRVVRSATGVEGLLQAARQRLVSMSKTHHRLMCRLLG